MRYDYVTMIEGLGGRPARCRRSTPATSHQTRRTTRNERPASDSIILVADAVTFGYDSVRCYATSTFDVHADQFIGIVGPPASGKTTLLRTSLGHSRPQRGSVEPPPGLRVGYVPQLETVNWNFPVTVASAC